MNTLLSDMFTILNIEYTQTHTEIISPVSVYKKTGAGNYMKQETKRTLKCVTLHLDIIVKLK